MYLFVFAFLGNVFYVASILSSPSVYLPPPISTDFLKESTPCVSSFPRPDLTLHDSTGTY